MAVSSRTFRSGNSDAVRLPREVTFGPGVDVEIERQGDVVTMYPKRMSPRQLVEKLRTLPKPSAVEKRQVILPPKRPGL